MNDQVVDQWGLASEIIALLKDQLKVKDEQIRNFQERDKENNILLKTFQDKIFLLEGGRPHNGRVVYEDRPERTWERGAEERGAPEGDVPTVPEQERGDAGKADVREGGESGGVGDEETVSPVADEEEIAGSLEPDGDAAAGVEEERGEFIEEPAWGEAEEVRAVELVETAEVTEKKTTEEGMGLPEVSEKKRGFWRRVFGGR